MDKSFEQIRIANMATFSLINVALLALVYVLYRLVSSFVTKRQFQAFAKQHGCEEPLNISGPFPWAFKRLFRMLCVISSGSHISKWYN